MTSGCGFIALPRNSQWRSTALGRVREFADQPRLAAPTTKRLSDGDIPTGSANDFRLLVSSPQADRHGGMSLTPPKLLMLKDLSRPNS